MIRKFAQIFAVIFVFTIPMENSITLGSLGSISRILGLVAAGLWGISVLSQNRLRSFTFFHVLIFSFLLFNVASIYWTVDFDLTFGRLKTYLQMAIQIWMLWDLFSTEKLFRAALLAFLLGAYLAVVSTIINFLSGQLIDEWEYGRYSGGGQNAVELALILSLCFPVAWHLAITQQAIRSGTLLKTVCYAFIPIGFFALILTASRTALFTVIPIVIYIIGSFSRFKPVYRILGFFIFIIAVFVGQSFIPSATLERLGTIGSSITSGDLGGRMDLWKQSLQIFLEHPLLGIGSGALAAPDQLGAFAHNTFISILTELGIIGFLLFLGVLVSAFYQVVKQPKPTSYLWLTVLIIWIIGVQSLTWEYTKPTWFFLSMIAISAGIFDRRTTLLEVRPIYKNSRYDKSDFRARLSCSEQLPHKSTSKSLRTR